MNFYYGLLDKATNTWGFVEETDPRVTADMLQVSEQQLMDLLQQQTTQMQICYLDGELFLDDPHKYYVDEQGWHKKSFDEFNAQKAQKIAQQLVNDIYEIKAQRAYGGVVINDFLIFETNQTSITNTVASIALMDDKSQASWKFYTMDGSPFVQPLNKTQLAYIAKFGRDMIDACFAIEGQYTQELQKATVDQLVDEDWVKKFLQQCKDAINTVENTITIKFE